MNETPITCQELAAVVAAVPRPRRVQCCYDRRLVAVLTAEQAQE